MPKRDLSLEIQRSGRRYDEINAHADPDDIGTLRDLLVGYLSGNRWAEARWGEFSMIVRLADGWSTIRTVRT